MQRRRCTQRSPMRRQSSEPAPLAVTGLIWSRWEQTGIVANQPTTPGGITDNRWRAMTAVLFVLITTFLASAVEAIEMVTIVLGVGATRGWRATLVGSVAGFAVLAVIGGAARIALS